MPTGTGTCCSSCSTTPDPSTCGPEVYARRERWLRDTLEAAPRRPQDPLLPRAPGADAGPRAAGRDPEHRVVDDAGAGDPRPRGGTRRQRRRRPQRAPSRHRAGLQTVGLSRHGFRHRFVPERLRGLLGVRGPHRGGGQTTPPRASRPRHRPARNRPPGGSTTSTTATRPMPSTSWARTTSAASRCR